MLGYFTHRSSFAKDFMNPMPDFFPVTCHTNRVTQGSTFVAIKGTYHDGASYIPQALERGATTIIIDQTSTSVALETLCKQHNAELIPVSNTRKELALRAAKASGYAWEKLKLIGVTGTKGKTTTTYLTEHLLKASGYSTAIAGSIVNRIGNDEDTSINATPESDYLHQFFAQCVAQNIEYVVLEISSHALSMFRIHGLEFDAVGFTNLAVDHLDYHQTMDNYFAAKMQLLNMIKPGGRIVINADAEWGQQAITWAEHNVPHATITTFSEQKNTSHKLFINSTTFDGIEFSLNATHIHCPTLFGRFNAYNIAMAALLCADVTVNPSAAFATFKGVPGRLQYHRLANGAHAFVDYAHNAFSVQETLRMLRAHTQQLIVVFGCGGNKPRERRFGMGKAAAEFADIIILTDDNPRFENRMDIINDILTGIPENKRDNVICIPDRDKAICAAAQQAQPHAIIALLGKGHQMFYEVNGKKEYFSDFEQIEKF